VPEEAAVLIETDLDVNFDGWTTIRGAPISE
jgi:hypothetical protein